MPAVTATRATMASSAISPWVMRNLPLRKSRRKKTSSAAKRMKNAPPTLSQLVFLAAPASPVTHFFSNASPGSVSTTCSLTQSKVLPVMKLSIDWAHPGFSVIVPLLMSSWIFFFVLSNSWLYRACSIRECVYCVAQSPWKVWS
jgi:hypothetical protein